MALLARWRGWRASPGGISTGAVLRGPVEVGKRPENKGRKIVVIIPSFAERYLSTVLFEGIG